MIVTVGGVVSSVICTVPVMTVLSSRLVNVVLSVLTHSLSVSMMFVDVVSATVPANVHCVSPCMIYHAGVVTYISQFTNGVLVYSDGNCNRALNTPVPCWVLIGVHIDGSPVHDRPDSI